jgi:hypothetical protein
MRTTGARHRFVPLFGDIHNHCGISYGHGTLQDAMENAALRLDFVSITGHAAWPDMDTADERISTHRRLSRGRICSPRRGVAGVLHPYRRIRSGNTTSSSSRATRSTPVSMATTRSSDVTTIFRSSPPGHPRISGGSCRRPAVRPGPASRMVMPDRVALTAAIPGFSSFPHHIGYRVGARGGNWDSFAEDYSPVVEILSMHGMAEEDHTDRPFLHSMGPLQHQGTLAEGLARGFRFGVLGNTDHHSAHPGSYGHGLTGVWATEPTREAIWEALYARRTWANSGDSVRLWYAVDGVPMGGEIALGGTHTHEIEVDGESAIDYVELIDNNGRRRLWWEDHPDGEDLSEAIVTLELGWGERGKAHAWQGSVAVLGAELREVMPRFRGQEVVSPLDAVGQSRAHPECALVPDGERNRPVCLHQLGKHDKHHAVHPRHRPADRGAPGRFGGGISQRLDLRVAVTDLLTGSRSANLGPSTVPLSG